MIAYRKCNAIEVVRGNFNMDEQKQAKVCYCRVCKQLDYAYEKCPNCGSTDIVGAYQDYMVGYGRHINMMRSIYDQHYGVVSTERS